MVAMGGTVQRDAVTVKARCGAILKTAIVLESVKRDGPVLTAKYVSMI